MSKFSWIPKILPVPMFFVLHGAIILVPSYLSCPSNADSAPLRTWKPGIMWSGVNLPGSLSEILVADFSSTEGLWNILLHNCSTFCFPLLPPFALDFVLPPWLFHVPYHSLMDTLCPTCSFITSSSMKFLCQSDATCFLTTLSGDTHFSSALIPSTEKLRPQRYYVICFQWFPHWTLDCYFDSIFKFQEKARFSENTYSIENIFYKMDYPKTSSVLHTGFPDLQ